MSHLSKTAAVVTMVALAGAVVATAIRERHGAAATVGGSAIPAGEPAPGTQRRWSLELVATLSPSDDAPAQTARLTGDWVTTISAVRPHERDVACELRDARVAGMGSSSNGQDVGALRRRLSRRFFVTQRKDGADLRVYFPRDMPPADRNLLLLVVTEVQLVEPANAGATWTALERDGAGLYLAAYRRDGDAGILKRKVRYVELDGLAAAPGLTVGVDPSERRFVVDGTASILSYEGADRLRLTTELTKDQALVMATTIRLGDPREGFDPQLAGSLEHASAELEQSSIRTQDVDPEIQLRRRDEALLTGHTAAELLAAADAPTPGPRLAERLSALFRLHPETIASALDRARRGAGTKTLLDALGAAATPQAVGAIAGLSHDSTLAAAIRADALTALVQLQHPSGAAMRLPLDLLDQDDASLRYAARLAAGALARAGRVDHRTDADAIDRALGDRFGGEPDAARRLELLAAMGNSAGPSLAFVLLRTLRDGAAPERAAAARSLRFVEGADTDRELAAAIEADHDARVRDAAIFAVRFRPFAPFMAAVERAATGDASESVRVAAVNLLGARLDADASVREVLSRVAGDDPKPGVRRLAEQLSTPPTPARAQGKSP